VAYCRSCGEALPPTARFCPSCGAASSDGPRGEERKLATILFADLVGSTALADSTDAERTRAVLNRFYDAMAIEIADMGGTVEKFVGDAVFAAFGAPSAVEDHADRAIYAALSMRRRLAELFGDKLALRIGINTGEVVVGKPRVGGAFVTGDTVNVAVRIEQAAEPASPSPSGSCSTPSTAAHHAPSPPTTAAESHQASRLVRPVVGNELDVVEPRLRCRNGDKHCVLVACSLEGARRLGRDTNRNPRLEIDHVADTPRLCASRDQEVDLLWT
jgi:class 3 adenylate cyclase